MECSIDVGCDNMGEFIAEVDRVARKTHRCCECRREIQRGEQYRVESGKWDGEFCTYKTCADCLSLRDVYFCGFEYTALRERLMEYIDEVDGELLDDRILKLTPGAREMLFSMIERYWDDVYLEDVEE